MPEMWEEASSLQTKWKAGNISRFDVTPLFVDFLLPEEANFDAGVFANLYIITSKKRGLFGVEASIRSPESRDELRLLLWQSSWIPFITGNDLWLEDHMDGAFSMWQHPTCAKHLPTNVPIPKIAQHSLNPNLDPELAAQFWKMGYDLGI